MRCVLLAILFAVSSSGHAAAVEWQTDPVAALDIAQRDQKLLLVYYRIPARGKTVGTDRAIATMERDELFVHALDAFVPLRIDGANAKSHPIVDELHTTREPILAIYDASGMQLALFPKLRAGWSTIAEEVLRFRGVRAAAAQSAALRLAGDPASADYLLGYVMRETRRLPESLAAFRRAAEGYRLRDDRVSEQLSLLGAAASRFALGQRAPARAEINEVLANPASKDVEAEGTFVLGSVFEALAMTPVRTVPGVPAATPAQRSPTAFASVIELYRKAYSLAAPGSMTEASARAALERLDKAPLPRKGDDHGQLRIVPPVRTTFTGHSQFRVDAPPAAARVDFFLDEVKVASSNRAPFRAAFDVGPTPRVRVVKARAWDTSGKPLGETALTINDRLDNFYVTIVNPATKEVRGKIGIEVDVKVPPGRSIADVSISWNGKATATLSSPPWVASTEAGGGAIAYLEAVATLDDGTTAGSTRVYNGALGEAVEVAAVTVLAVVSHRDGTPARDLTASDFRIEDEGRVVGHELVSGPDDPVTIGLAIDSSSSMQGRQLYALRAATTFLERALRPVDRAFVVAFDTGARLVHERSNDLASLRASILDLMPAGGTSIFDGATFALQQFQGIAGRKALIVVSDGLEGKSTADAREAERLARTVGVPVYLFVPRGGGGRLGHALSPISELTGGSIYHGVAETEFDATFARLAEELRAQYVLQYRMPQGVASGAWREIKVTVPNRDVTVRTIAGYRAN